jgi:transposase
VLGNTRFQHGGEGIAQLLDWLSQITSEADPGTVAVALEAPRAASIDALLERGYSVYSINPKQLDRFRDRFSVAGAKDDGRDAHVLADSLRTDLAHFRQLRPDDPQIVRLRELTRAQDIVSQDFRRSANQLWSYLQRYFPAVLKLSPAAAELWLFDLIEQIQAQPQLAARLSARKLETFLRRHRIRRFTSQELRQLLQHPLPLATGVAAALAEQVLLLLPRLRLLQQQHSDLSHRVETLLEQLSQDQNFPQRRSVEILRSIPGIGQVFTATALSEATTPLIERDYHALRALSGVAPVTKQSGKSKLISMRRACNNRLREALHCSANVHIQKDPRARKIYARLRAQGNSHARALRGVADRLLKLICALLQTDSLYDPARRALPSASDA